MAKLGPGPYGFFNLAEAQAGQKILVTLVDETDVETLETGVSSPTIQASKNGAAYASLSDGTWAELANGDYTITLDATDTDSLGWLLIRVIKSGTSAEAKVLCNVGISNNELREDMIRTRAIRRHG